MYVHTHIYIFSSIFSNNSSSTHYSKQSQHIKKNAEKTKLNFKSNNLEDYNRPFSLSDRLYYEIS